MIYRCIFDLSKKEIELKDLETKSQAPNLWNDRDQAQSVMKKMADLREEITYWTTLERRVAETRELIELNDDSLQGELEGELSTLEAEISVRELSTLLSGPYDQGNALLTISSGAGGTDSQDWASMLERMYLRCPPHNQCGGL